jgi:Leucine-rich repeat (LRR) protein
MSLDLSYNHLDDLPYEFHAAHMPYFYGIDLSYNRFSQFPFEPFDCASLTMMAIRGQRDENGQRCLKEWPTGVYNHTGLRALYLGSNDLGKIDDTISYLIYYLDISDNPNIVFDASDICYQWMNGVYFLLYDKTQDIRGCEAMLY